MSRPKAIAFLVGRVTRIVGFETRTNGYKTMVHRQTPNYERTMDQSNDPTIQNKSGKDSGGASKRQIGQNVSRKDKINFLVSTLSDLKDSKEAVYGTLDAWVAWEKNFPIASIKVALAAMEKEEQWHRIVQVIKWMLSKGQGTTMGTYGQLIKALDMDNRPEEAHRFWVKRIGIDLHSVPWQLCRCMISIYYRNNMLENLVKLFKGLEAYDRKPQDKAEVLKVANAYELLGYLEEKERILEKYKDLFSETREGRAKKAKKRSSKEMKKSGDIPSTSDGLVNVVNDIQKPENNHEDGLIIRVNSAMFFV